MSRTSHPTSERSGHVIVRLENLTVRRLAAKADTLIEYLSRSPEIRRWLEQRELPGERLVRSTPPEKILRLEGFDPERSRARPSDSLASYWTLDLRGREREIDGVVRALRRREEVDTAYAHEMGDEPDCAPDEDPSGKSQGYLEPAPKGTGATWAHKTLGARGAGVKISVVERSWYLNHPAICQRTPELVHGEEFPKASVRRHGTRVLGILIANRGVDGLAREAGPVHCVSHYTKAKGSGFVAEAITYAAENGGPGEILVIEHQNAGPSERFDDVYKAVKNATEAGITVFAPSGNSGADLRKVQNQDSKSVFDPASADYRDSGAVIVSAAYPGVHTLGNTKVHNWLGSSNLGAYYGDRVNCYGWGSMAGTSSSIKTDGSGFYVQNFGKTSAATAIVAGVGAVLQGLHHAQTQEWLSPQELRDLLSTHGTPGAPTPGNIGVLPDLAAIAAAQSYTLMVEWRGNLYPATVLETDGERTRVHYVGHDDSWDEWVGPERIRRPQN